jgi:hypothetical protein
VLKKKEKIKDVDLEKEILEKYEKDVELKMEEEGVE